MRGTCASGRALQPRFPRSPVCPRDLSQWSALGRCVSTGPFPVVSSWPLCPRDLPQRSALGSQSALLVYFPPSIPPPTATQSSGPRTQHTDGPMSPATGSPPGQVLPASQVWGAESRWGLGESFVSSGDWHKCTQPFAQRPRAVPSILSLGSVKYTYLSAY